MKYRVLLTDRADADVESAIEWYQHQSATAADKWFAELMAAIATLENHPQRCGRAIESDDLQTEVRELHIGKRRGKYRILFQISGQTVCILRIWHSVRRDASPDELR